MEILKELQHKFLCALRSILHAYEGSLFERSLVRLGCHHRKPLMSHLERVRELVTEIENELDTSLHEFRHRATASRV